MGSALACNDGRTARFSLPALDVRVSASGLTGSLAPAIGVAAGREAMAER
jgi:hypothetical protein